MKYVALLRGINVGGNNLIKMVELKKCFETMGFDDVSTYIQSGNVIFDAPKQDIGKLTTKIERGLSKSFAYTASVVVISHDHLKGVVKEAPKGFGGAPALYRYNVMFLKLSLSPSEALKHIGAKEGVDTAAAGKGVVYYSILISKATQSRISKVIGTPVYSQITIRNWNTTTKLLELMDATK